VVAGQTNKNFHSAMISAMPSLVHARIILFLLVEPSYLKPFKNQLLMLYGPMPAGARLSWVGIEAFASSCERKRQKKNPAAAGFCFKAIAA